jgi:hypothetical protein
MAGAISDLKAQARILHRQIVEREPVAMARSRQLPEFKDRTSLRSLCIHQAPCCLAVVARGSFKDGHMGGVLGGTDSTDFRTLLYPDGANAPLEHLGPSYAEARAIREQHGECLLAYRRHFFIVDRRFIKRSVYSRRIRTGN